MKRKAKEKREGKESCPALRDYYEEHCKSDDDDEGGNKKSV